MSESPKAFQICSNKECARYDQEIETDITSYGYVSPFCQLCHSKAEVAVRHHQKKFSSHTEFETYAAGLSREYKLLKRLVAAGLADENELDREGHAEAFLKGLRCSCCNQPFLPEVDDEKEPNNAQQADASDQSSPNA